MAATLAIRNSTRGTVLADRCVVASSMGDRIVGLLDHDHLDPGGGLLIERTQSIHTFFMRFAIDVVFIDASDRVTKGRRGTTPWRVVWWARGVRDRIERLARSQPRGRGPGTSSAREPITDRYTIVSDPAAHDIRLVYSIFLGSPACAGPAGGSGPSSASCCRSRIREARDRRAAFLAADTGTLTGTVLQLGVAALRHEGVVRRCLQRLK